MESAAAAAAGATESTSLVPGCFVFKRIQYMSLCFAYAQVNNFDDNLTRQLSELLDVIIPHMIAMWTVSTRLGELGQKGIVVQSSWVEAQWLEMYDLLCDCFDRAWSLFNECLSEFNDRPNSTFSVPLLDERAPDDPDAAANCAECAFCRMLNPAQNFDVGASHRVEEVLNDLMREIQLNSLRLELKWRTAAYADTAMEEHKAKCRTFLESTSEDAPSDD